LGKSADHPAPSAQIDLVAFNAYNHRPRASSNLGYAHLSTGSGCPHGDPVRSKKRLCQFGLDREVDILWNIAGSLGHSDGIEFPNYNTDYLAASNNGPPLLPG
jgi:hypothetical protein